MDTNGKLFIILTGTGEFQYSLHEIRDAQVAAAGEETTPSIGPPLLTLDKSTFAESSKFAAIGSRIYVVGGKFCQKRPCVASRKVFIIDTKSRKVDPAPDLNTPKRLPKLFTFGSKLFALTNAIYKLGGDDFDLVRPLPTFEVLDTDDLGSGWSSLPMPTLIRYQPKVAHSIEACAAFVGITGKRVIIVTYGGAGTYVFEVDEKTWSYVGKKPLPFSGQAQTIPSDHSLCFACSTKYKRMSAFRIAYEVDPSNPSFTADAVYIDYSYCFGSQLPQVHHLRPMDTTLGPNGRVYFVGSGVDNPHYEHDGYQGNRYIIVSALVLYSPNKKKKRETTEETNELAMCMRWRMTFDGGPVGEPYVHVGAAFAM